MALITPTKAGNPAGHVTCWKYTGVDENSTFAPIPVASKADVSMQCYGTFGGATFGAEGSNVGDKDKSTLLAADFEALTRAGKGVIHLFKCWKFRIPSLAVHIFYS